MSYERLANHDTNFPFYSTWNLGVIRGTFPLTSIVSACFFLWRSKLLLCARHDKNGHKLNQRIFYAFLVGLLEGLGCESLAVTWRIDCKAFRGCVGREPKGKKNWQFMAQWHKDKATHFIIELKTKKFLTIFIPCWCLSWKALEERGKKINCGSLIKWERNFWYLHSFTSNCVFRFVAFHGN